MNIESNRLRISEMDQTMYYDVYRNSLDEDNRKFVPDEVFETIEEASEVVDAIISNYNNEDGPFVYAVIRKEDNANVGYVQLVKIEEGWEIGYHIAKLFTKKGYATEAVNLFLEHLKNTTELKEVYGIALANNHASRRVLEKCGFILYFEGFGIYQGKRRKIVKTIKSLRQNKAESMTQFYFEYLVLATRILRVQNIDIWKRFHIHSKDLFLWPNYC